MVQSAQIGTTLKAVEMVKPFEKRGITLLLMQRVRDFALKRNPTKSGYWLVGRLASNICGCHEIVGKPNRWGEVIPPESTLTFGSKSSLIEMLEEFDEIPHPELGVTYSQVNSTFHISLTTIESYLSDPYFVLTYFY